MTYIVDFTPLARIELLQAGDEYSQVDLQRGGAFFIDVARAEQFLQNNPHLYTKIEGDVRRAVLKRFPYSLFYTIKGKTVTVLACFHQSRQPALFVKS
ncbi:MAG: type II toxin-antitoxin system RelE/ParE family toxin [Cytophagales bacterium]|nr:type II toxin-antitoxin system RelE/ParE family toxin [Cytophagales bacterium]